MGWMLVIKVIVLVTIVFAVVIFVLKKVLFDTTQGAVNRLERETQDVRGKQNELNEKIKQANEELTKRKAEANALVAKMKTDAEEQARLEREKIIKKARSDGEDIIAKAQNTKAELRKEIEKEMQMKAVDFCNVLMKEMLTEYAQGAFNEALVSEFLDKLENIDMEMITEDITSAELVAASDLEKNFRERLSEILTKKLAREITIQVKIEPEILGGVILSFGSLKLDGSLATNIRETGLVVKEKIERGLLRVA